MSGSLQAQSLTGAGQRVYDEFREFGPQRAFVTAGDGKVFWWAAASGADPGRALESALKACRDKGATNCAPYAVNNILLDGRDWQAVAPPASPPIGRLRGQPWWINKGPQAASGLIVWSHGYRTGTDSTNSAPQAWIGQFTSRGYDLYRFDREFIRDWPGDATQLAAAVQQARAMGYRRIVLAGQSAGAWVSLAAAQRGAAVDGVVAIAAAHHGEVKTMSDVSIARSAWQQMMRGLKPGPRFVIVNFANDSYDVGGRMEDAMAAVAASGVQADIIANPAGFSGHGAGSDLAFARRYGPCILAFVEQGARQTPC